MTTFRDKAEPELGRQSIRLVTAPEPAADLGKRADRVPVVDAEDRGGRVVKIKKPGRGGAGRLDVLLATLD